MVSFEWQQHSILSTDSNVCRESTTDEVLFKWSATTKDQVPRIKSDNAEILSSSQSPWEK